MALFSFGRTHTRYGVIIDIGSGSVLTAIVASDATMPEPTIIWAHREHAPLKPLAALKESAKGVMTALVNASMKLDSEGRTALRAYASNATLTEMQVAISAPWCYTVSKTISYRQEAPFEVTEELLTDLIATAERQVEQELLSNESVSHLGLAVVTRGTMDVMSNGYRVTNPIHEQASFLELSQATVVAQTYLIDAINEMQTKLFTRATTQKLSFMLMLYCTARETLPHTDDVCLIDVTYEATEMGIIRDGSLHYSTHVPFGLFSLAREISVATNLPLTEVFNQLRTPHTTTFFNSQSDTVRTEIDAIITAYTERITGLFHETGDTLSIPKKIFLHVDHAAEPLLKSIVEKAAKKATKIDHAVSSAAGALGLEQAHDLFTDASRHHENDTALLLSAKFFHKPTHCLEFKYL